MSKVCWATGSASGLGRDIAETAPASGDRLIATARDPRRAGFESPMIPPQHHRAR